MRRLHELYKIVHAKMKEGSRAEPLDLAVWLCMHRHITTDEHSLLILHMKIHKPTVNEYPEFYKHPKFVKQKGVQRWWWDSTPDSRRQMRLWVMKMKSVTRHAKEE